MHTKVAGRRYLGVVLLLCAGLVEGVLPAPLTGKKSSAILANKRLEH
jgi:hypothetical protein